MKQPPTEITVTGSCNGRHQRQGRPMRVAAHPKTGIHKAMIARIGCLRSNNPLLQESQRLSSLESRSRWKLPHNRTVQQWFPTVTRQFQMIFTPLAPHHQSWVKSGSRYHTKYFSCGWLDSHYTAYLPFQQTLSQHLKLYVYT